MGLDRSLLVLLVLNRSLLVPVGPPVDPVGRTGPEGNLDLDGMMNRQGFPVKLTQSRFWRGIELSPDWSPEDHGFTGTMVLPW